MNPQHYPFQPTQNRYPTLPPVQTAQNPLYSHPFPSSQAQGGYVPPAAHGQIQARPSQEIDIEKIINTNRLKQLDESLENFGTSCYKIWLWLVISVSCLGIYVILLCFNAGYTKAMNFAWFAVSGWSLAKSALGVRGVSQKNLTKVNVAFWMTIGSALLYIAAIVATYVEIERQMKSAGEYTNLVFKIFGSKVFVVVFGFLAKIYLIIEMIGVWRVRKIMIEREVVKAKLEDVNESFNKI